MNMKGCPILLSAICWMLFVCNVPATVFYVDVNSINPVPPFTNWITAATNIQDAVDAATNGDLVLVTNGIYATGGRRWFDSGTNRVTLTNSITLRSVNGPAVTLIVGSQVVGTGPALVNAVRCVGMGNNAVLSGFTLTNGEGGFGNYPAGGGVAYIYGAGAGTVTNCILTGNLATNSAGGGAFRVTLINCQIVGNSAASGGGACACTLINCTIVSNTATSGGGVFGSTTLGASVLTNCTIAGNSATNGGGAYGAALTNCVLIGNSAQNGGGMYQGSANNCLIISNTASVSGGGAHGGTAGAMLVNSTLVGNAAGSSGGGVYGGTGAWLYNCIAYFNSAPAGTNLIGAKFNNTCTTPPLTGGSGITNEPVFVNFAAGNFRLQTNSPCIDAGNNAYVSGGTDLDGRPRIVGGTVDMGAYEFQGAGMGEFIGWLQQYGLPTDGTADYADSDGDGMNNYAEWKAGTIPTDAASVLKLLSPSNSVSGITVTWQSVNTRTYYLQSSTNLPDFTSIQSNIVGQADSTSYTDITATNGGPYYYRVGIQ
jgi:hypothetical protein